MTIYFSKIDANKKINISSRKKSSEKDVIIEGILLDNMRIAVNSCAGCNE